MKHRKREIQIPIGAVICATATCVVNGKILRRGTGKSAIKVFSPEFTGVVIHENNFARDGVSTASARPYESRACLAFFIAGILALCDWNFIDFGMAQKVNKRPFLISHLNREYGDVLGQVIHCFKKNAILLEIALCVLRGSLAGGQTPAVTPSSRPSEGLISLNFPPNVELKVLIQYVSDRLGINFLYDDQAVAQHITIVSPVRVSRESLLGLLESTLKMKGLVVVDGDQPGWKKILPATNLSAVAGPTTRNSGAATQPAAAVTQIFVLRYADPARAETVIKPLLTQPGGNSIPLPDQHLLIVSDYASTLVRVEELLRLMDQAPRDVVTRFVAIKNLEVTALVSPLQQILSARSKSQVGSPGGAAGETLEVLQDTRTNRLILVGTPEKVETAAQLASSLDVPLPLETKVYSLKSIAPDRLDRLVRETIDPQDARRLYQSAVDKESGLLVVTATPAIHQKVLGMKEQLDIPVTAEASPIRFYKLTNTTAADALATIRALEGNQQTSTSSDQTSGGASPTQPQSPSQIPGATGSSASPLYHDITPAASIGSALPAPSATAANGAAAPPASPNPASAAGAAPSGGTDALALSAVRTSKAMVTADPNTNTIIVEADPATQKVYEGLIKMLDKRRPQVLIECTLVTLDTTDNFSLGVELGADSQGKPRIVTFNSFGLSTPNASTGVLTLTPGAGFNGTLLASNVAQVVIQALQTHSRSKVLSAPRILVNDNATGTLSSVAEQPFTSVNASTTVATTSFAGYASAGTTITLTPHISEGDHLQLEYVVTLNNFSGQSSNGVPPPRQTDSVQSKITIPDGSTVIVGGLNSSNFSDSRQTVPFLGEIPLLKELLSQHNRNQGQSTLFVFIRPVILRDDQFQDLKYFSQRDVEAAGIPGDYPQSQALLIR
jgi:type II secretory pathway component GspD/PulD (secretin)